MVGSNAVHADGLLRNAAEEIASANDDGNLAAALGDLGNLLGNGVNEEGVDAETTAGGQGFSGKLEEDTLVHARYRVQGLRVRV